MLSRLHILIVVSDSGKPRAYGLTKPFAASLRLALTGGGKHKSFGVLSNIDNEEPVIISQLDEFARKQWEGVLGYMVGSTGISLSDEGVNLSQGVKTLLRIGGLVEVKGKHVGITQEGFAFVLQEVNAQVWTILILYLENAQEVCCARHHGSTYSISFEQLTSDKLGMDSVDVLSFLFMLGSLELGQPYSKATLTPTQTQMLLDLGDFGIILQPTPSSPSFYPTRLATTLTSDAGALRSSALADFSSTALSSASSDGSKGFIVIETNYRVYAYTSSQLQIAILQLFVKLNTRYPNMVSGKITRESIRHAVSMGITSQQIISFLSTHAHPQMLKKAPTTILPPTVVDQIRLWQIEGERMKATTGFLFKEFGSAQEYEGPCRYAEEIGVLVWKSESRRMFFVTSHQQVAVWLKNKRSKG